MHTRTYIQRIYVVLMYIFMYMYVQLYMSVRMCVYTWNNTWTWFKSWALPLHTPITRCTNANEEMKVEKAKFPRRGNVPRRASGVECEKLLTASHLWTEINSEFELNVKFQLYFGYSLEYLPIFHVSICVYICIFMHRKNVCFSYFKSKRE